MSRSSVTCPSCGHALAWRTVLVEFQCGTCGRSSWFRLLQYARFRTWIFPPRIELRDGVQGVVSRLPIPVTTGPVLLETLPIERNPVSEVSGKYWSRLFEFPDPPHTFEGLMLGAAVVFILSTPTWCGRSRSSPGSIRSAGRRRWGRKDFR